MAVTLFLESLLNAASDNMVQSPQSSLHVLVRFRHMEATVLTTELEELGPSL